MEFFDNASVVRLRSLRNKYLVACPDKKSVRQCPDASSENALWTVEIVEEIHIPHIRLRLKSCHGRYLTATDTPTLFKKTSRKVLQTIPSLLDSEVEWKPLRWGPYVQMKSRYGLFLCANRGFFQPWRRNAVSHCVFHDNPCGYADSLSLLWDVDAVELKPEEEPLPDLSEPESVGSISLSGWLEGDSSSDSEELLCNPPFPPLVRRQLRLIYFAVGNDDGEVDETEEESFIIFRGNSIARLKTKLEEETCLDDIVVCFREPVNNKLCPLRLPLPPGDTPMHVIAIE